MSKLKKANFQQPSILLIDKIFNPLRAIPRKKAYKLEYLKKGFFITPEILQLQDYIHKRQFHLRYTKKSVYARDKNICQYCGKKLSVQSRTIDHVVPITRGGTSSFENCVASCSTCNKRKDRYLPHEVGMTLLRKPKVPNAIEIMKEQHKMLFEKFYAYILGN